jgi:hypothetical protein
MRVPTVHREQKHGVLGTFCSGDREQSLGVSGTDPLWMILIFKCNYHLPNPLTSLTQNINLSNSQTVPNNPMVCAPPQLEAQPIRGLRFPRKGKNPFLDYPLKHGGGQGGWGRGSISSLGACAVCMTGVRACRRGRPGSCKAASPVI